MLKIYKKVKHLISLKEFETRAIKISSFSSSRGQRYKVQSVEGNVMHFIRLDAKSSRVWDMDLELVYRAYSELDDFATINFKLYVPITHSPARGLLIHMGLLE
jgi:hypothetical protein